MDQKEQASQVPNSFPATIGKKLSTNAPEFIPNTSSSTSKKLNPNAPEFIPRTTSSTATQPPPSSSLTISGPSLPSFRFTHDIFEDMFPAPYYYTLTRPMEMKVVLCWPHSVDGVDLDGVVPKFYIHGIFSEDRAVWLSKSNYANLEFRTKAEYRHGRLWEVDGLFQEYKDEIPTYWPSLKKPESLEAAKVFFLYEWRRHGFQTGMSARMYLFYALAIRAAITDNFDIPIGVPISLKEALKCIREVMGKLRLFGKPVGAELNPEIHIGIGMIDNAHTINDIRLPFLRSIDDRGKAEFEYIGAKPKKESPKATIDEQTLLILPSKDQMEQLLAKSGGVSLNKKFAVV